MSAAKLHSAQGSHACLETGLPLSEVSLSHKCKASRMGLTQTAQAAAAVLHSGNVLIFTSLGLGNSPCCSLPRL